MRVNNAEIAFNNRMMASAYNHLSGGVAAVQTPTGYRFVGGNSMINDAQVKIVALRQSDPSLNATSIREVLSNPYHKRYEELFALVNDSSEGSVLGETLNYLTVLDGRNRNVSTIPIPELQQLLERFEENNSLFHKKRD